MLVWILIIVGVVILDQGTKLLMMNLLPNVKDTIPIIQDFFHFTHVRNTGMAFGMLGGEKERWIFIIVSIIGIAALIVYLWKFRPESKWACAALSMVIGGGIGNMIDRCFLKGEIIVDGKSEIRHYVFDFIDFCGIWPFVFNVADAFVCVGAGILMVWCVYSFVQEVKLEKQKKLAAEGNAENTEIVEENALTEEETEENDENSSDSTEENSEEN